MADNGRMFRTSISGYNKDDVNRYILEVDKKNKETAESLKNEISALSAENETASAALRQAETEKAELAARIAELEEEILRLQEEQKAQSERIDSMMAEHTVCETQLAEQNSALSEMKEENAVLIGKLDTLSSESAAKDALLKAAAEKYAADLETLRSAYEGEIKAAKEAAKPDESAAYKLDMYDRISSQIGDILINANRSSDEIVTAARTEAEKLLSRTTADAAARSTRMREGIHNCAVQTLARLKEDFVSNMTNCAGELQTCIKEIQYETEALMAFLTRKQSEMSERIEFYYGAASDTVEHKVETMAEECGSIISQEQSSK